MYIVLYSMWIWMKLLSLHNTDLWHMSYLLFVGNLCISLSVTSIIKHNQSRKVVLLENQNHEIVNIYHFSLIWIPSLRCAEPRGLPWPPRHPWLQSAGLHWALARVRQHLEPVRPGRDLREGHLHRPRQRRRGVQWGNSVRYFIHAIAEFFGDISHFTHSKDKFSGLRLLLVLMAQPFSQTRVTLSLLSTLSKIQVHHIKMSDCRSLYIMLTNTTL